MINLFKETTVEEQAQILANFLPNGKLFEAKNISDSLYRAFLRGLGQTNKQAADLLSFFSEQLDISATEAFLDEWEATVGIPDSCFSGTGTDDQRRRDILTKLAALGVQTAQDFINVAAIFGFTVKVYSQAEAYPGHDPKFTIVVEYAIVSANVFTLYFPIYFGDPEVNILVCLFNKLKPANCRIIFTNTALTRAFSSGFSSGFV